MNQRQIRDALVQTLENYQRCGIQRIPCDELSPELTAAIESWNSAVAEASDQESERPQPSAHIPPRSAVAPNLAAAPTANGGPAIQSKSWLLPVLDMGERQAKMAEIDAQVKACRACKNIVDFRQQTVLGDGTLQPKICFMGEAPGADEDRQGIPFVGKAGQLLTRIIGAMQLKRDDVYILNALKCRPPQNRTPVPDEIDFCRGYVEAQLETLKPEYIVCLGAVAVRSILQSSLSIGRLRGRFHEYRGARVVVTYHPSYLLRNESAKRLVWDDMKMLMREVGVDL